jgi:hypothetical protein
VVLYFDLEEAMHAGVPAVFHFNLRAFQEVAASPVCGLGGCDFASMFFHGVVLVFAPDRFRQELRTS